MRKSVVLSLAAIAVGSLLLLSACSSDSGTPAATGTGAAAGTGAATSQPSVPATKTGATTGDTLSSSPNKEPRPFPDVTALSAPPAVIDAIKSKRAFFLVYYDPSQSVTPDQKKVVAALQAKYGGLVQFIPYDLPSSDLASTDTEKKQADQVAELGQRLELGYMPAIVIVTRDGQITWQSTGFQDYGPLEREILRATR